MWYEWFSWSLDFGDKMAEFTHPVLQIWRSPKLIVIQIQLMNIHIWECRYYCLHLVPKFGDVRNHPNCRQHPTDEVRKESSESWVTLYTAGHLHTAVPHCSHSRAPIVHTAVPRENNEHGCVYLRCPYPEPMYTGRSSVHWNATGWPSVHWDITGPPSEYLQGTLEHHWKKLSWNSPHWNATGETLTFAAYTGTPLEGLWQPTQAPTHIVKHAE